VVLAGHSLGSMAALELAETYPTLYDGALVACGFVGGTPKEIAYMANARIAFDYFFPGVIPGSVFDISPGMDDRPGTPQFNAVQAVLVGASRPRSTRSSSLPLPDWSGTTRPSCAAAR